MCWILDRKMIVTFLMISTSSITLQSSGEIELRALAAGAKMWCAYMSCLSRFEAGALFVRGVHS